MSIAVLNNDVLESIFDKIDSVDTAESCSTVSRTFNTIVNKHMMKEKLRFYLTVIYNRTKEKIFLTTIKNKLIANGLAKQQFLESINTENMYDFDKSIEWGENRNLDREWLDIIFSNRLSNEEYNNLWNKDEICFFRSYEIDYHHRFMSNEY